MDVHISIRDVNENTFKEFKSMAAKKGLNMAEAFDAAVSRWLASEKSRKRLRFLDFEPWDWGPGTENASMEIDQFLYGGKMPK